MNRWLKTLLWLAIALAGSTVGSTLLPAPAAAHDALPIVISLDQTGSDRFLLSTTVPPTYPDGYTPQVGVSGPCEIVGREGHGRIVACPPGMAPTQLKIAYPGSSGNSPLILQVAPMGRPTFSVAAPPGSQRIAVPDEPRWTEVFAGFFAHGVDHIIGGYDHLLFLICLMLIARTAGRVALVVSGFTLGHAVTIGLAATGVIALDAIAVEVLIALSICFVAAEIVRGERAASASRYGASRARTLTWRRPVHVAALFGLLHGLGFAGALREIGLPEGQLMSALIAFNLGVELGQLGFVAVLGAAAWLSRRSITRIAARLPDGVTPAMVTASAIGIIASVWFFDRLGVV